MNDLLRHIQYFFGYAFFFTLSSFVFSQDSISFNQFDENSIESIIFPLDETGQNTFYFDEQNPNIGSDIHSGSAILDGSLGYPLGAFYLHEIDFVNIGKTDSSHVVSELLYRQGDYLLRETGIGLGKQFENGNTLMFRGFGRSYSGRYGEVSNGGNILQNYRVDYNGKLENTQLDLSYGYHIEEITMRSSESMFGGIKLAHNNDRFDFQFHSAFHISHIADSTTKTEWKNAHVSTKFDSPFQLLVDVESKRKNGQSIEHQYVNPSIQLVYKKRHISMVAGVRSTESVEPIFSIDYHLNENLKIHLNRKNQISFNNLSNDSLNYFTTNSIELEYSNDSFKFSPSIRLLEFESENIPSMSLIAEYENSWASLQSMIVAFDAFGSNEIWLNGYSQSSLKISPQLKTKRFRPYIQCDGIFWSNRGLRSLDFDVNSTLFGMNDNDTIANNLINHSLNFEFGFVLKSFQISYRMTNILQNPIEQPTNLLPIASLNYLEVIWLFND
jgi:hypothetical protein